MRILDNIISDRGSKYAVSGGPCRNEDEAKDGGKHLGGGRFRHVRDAVQLYLDTLRSG